MRAVRSIATSIGIALTACATLAFPGASAAQSPAFPQRPVTLVVPFAPGGGTDSVARDLGARLAEKLGQPVVIENKGGAGGTIGADFVARSRPDGHTLLLMTSTFVTHAATGAKLPYEPTRDFAPIALLGRGPLVVVTARDAKLESITALVAAAKGKPGTVAFCSAGPGSINHLAGELFAQRAGVTMTHVPYKGSGPAIVDLLAGRTQAFFATVPSILGQVKADKVKLVAVTSRERSPLFPGTPTVIEAGIPDYAVQTWWGVAGAAGTPAPIAAALNRAVNDASAAPDLAKRFADEGAERFAGPPEALAQTIVDELAAWRAVVKSAGLRFE
jgi:tripartite-type tricarboxylate transporter receptor subunit TctC